MTTIAFRDGVLAADTAMTDGCVSIRTTKIVPLPDGRYWAGAGDASACVAVGKWLAGGCEGRRPRVADVEGLIVGPDGVEILAARWPAMPVTGFVAVGSGAQAAMAAMHMGAAAHEAVEVAAAVDVATAAPVESVYVCVPANAGST
jgi:20S proteasome alpha/beta subunit